MSLFSKKDLFLHFGSLHNPDFIAGSESWLSSSVLNSEIFPPNFTIFRKDRDGGHGGVFIARKSDIQCKHLEIDTECELVACEIELPSGPPLVIVSVYQPPYNNLDYMDNLTDTINCIANDHKIPQYGLLVTLTYQT